MDADYKDAKSICKEFEIENLGKSHDLYVKSDTLLLAYIFQSFRNNCIEINELDPAHFRSAPRLARHQKT